MKRIILISLLFISLLLSSCTSNNSKNKTEVEVPLQVNEEEIVYTNMADQDSLMAVEGQLKAYIESKNVEEFISQVRTYNTNVENMTLTGDFQPIQKADYDQGKIQELLEEKQGDFIGLNCRLTTFMLLRDQIEVKTGQADPSLLFMDEDAIKVGNLFNPEELSRFQEVYSRVETKSTKDVKIHGQNMEEYFSKIKFDEKARMISVVLHDTLDGDHLFIGHVGVLTEAEGGYFFVEKLSFTEPFQGVKFLNKEDCYRYLYSRYEQYHDETSSKPFIMDNGDFVDLDLYYK